MYGSFEGIRVYIYARDHNPPHFHAYYGEFEAVISIQTLEVLAGNLPSKQLKRVEKWASLIKNNLLEEFIKLQGI